MPSSTLDFVSSNGSGCLQSGDLQQWKLWICQDLTSLPSQQVRFLSKNHCRWQISTCKKRSQLKIDGFKNARRPDSCYLKHADTVSFKRWDTTTARECFEDLCSRCICCMELKTDHINNFSYNEFLILMVFLKVTNQSLEI